MHFSWEAIKTQAVFALDFEECTIIYEVSSQMCIQKSSKYSKENDKKSKFTSNLQSEHSFIKIIAFWNELKSCCMLCYGMLWYAMMNENILYDIVCYGMPFQC